MRLILRLFLLLLAWGALGRTAALAQTCSTAITTFNFNTRPNGEDWTNRSAVGVPDAAGATTVTTLKTDGTKSYTSASATTSTLRIAAANSPLTWTNDFSSVVNGTSQVTFTFNRAVSNFTVNVGDVDAAFNNPLIGASTGYTDQVVFAGANAGTAVTPTLSSTSGATLVTIVGTTATGVDDGNTNTAAVVTASFPQAITTLTITYKSGPITGGVTNPDAQIVTVNQMTWCRLAPAAKPLTNATTIPTNAGQVGIDGLDFITLDASLSNYTVTAIPNAAQGVLYYNSTGTTYAAVANNQTLTPAQAASLRFDPADGATGPAVFSYTVTDTNAPNAPTGSLTSPAVNFTIPLSTQTPCASTASLDFSTRTTGEDWKNHAALSVPTGSPLTQVSTSGYTVDAASSANSNFAIGVQTTGNTIKWDNNYANGSAKTSSVTFTFTRPVSNFTVRVEDIDTGTNYLDQVVFAGKNGATTVTPTLSPVDPNQPYFTISGNTATGIAGQANNNTRDGASVIAYFPSPITSLTLSYNNAAAGATSAAQTVGVDLMNWCRLAPVANPVASTVSDAATKAAVGALTSQVDGTATSYSFTSVPSTAQGTLYIGNTAVTTGTVITAAQVNQLTFTPAAGFTGTFNLAYTVKDDANQVSSPATYAITVSASGAAGTPAACANPGRDGSPTLTTNPNTYYPSTAGQTLAAGATSIAVGVATGTGNIAAGDLLLVIQMQGADINATNTDAYGDGVTGGGANGNLNTNFAAGTYEYVVANSAITATAGGNITLATALKNGYVNAVATATTGQRSFQVIRVPQFGNLTLGGNITPTPWNGSVGGIIAIDVAKQTNFNGFTIDVSGAGFRGGAGRRLQGGAAGVANTDYVTSANLAENGTKGEGIAGTPRYVNANNTTLVDTRTTVTGYPAILPATFNDGYPSGDNARGAPGNAGGGGTDGEPGQNQWNSGGGGGANGGAGGRGGNSFSNNLPIGGEPGAAFAAASSSRLVLGGGGGSGTTNDGTGTPGNGFASSGAAGGGIVMLRTGTVSGTGIITANGASAIATTSGNGPPQVQQDGGGGGGAGGSILITATTTSGLSGLTLNALGGTGGNTNPNAAGNAGPHGPGGGGGGGVILTNGTANSLAVTGGTNGLTTANGSTTGVAFGAAPGVTGDTNAQISNSVANSVSGATCPADVTTTITGPATLSVGQPAGSYPNYTATFTNNGTGTASNVTQTVTLPAGATVTAANLPTGATFATVGTGATAVTTVNFGTAASLANGATNTFSFSFTAPATAGSYPLATNVATDANQGANTAADAATLTIQVNNAPANCGVSYYDNTNSYSGLSAFYYQGDYNNNPAFFSGKTPTDKGIASTINYLRTVANTGGTFPITSATVNATNNAFSAQYKGNVYITTAGSYTFSLSNPAVGNLDDRAQLYLDGKAVPASGTPIIGGANISVTSFNTGTPTVTLNLSAGTHNILLQYSATGQPDRVSLSYSGPDSPTLTVIPNSVLCAGLGNIPPIALNGTNANIPNNAGPTTLSPSLNVTNGTATGTDQDGTVTSFVLATLPTAAQGVLRLSNGTAVVTGQTYTVAQTAGFTFQPVSSFTGPASFTFSAIDNTGQLSNDVATYTIPVAASADVTTTLAGPAVLNAGQPSGTFTATFTNNGPNTASGVTQTVTIPAGATNVLVNGVAYTPTGNVINFGTATTLANGATNTFTYSFTAPTTAGTVMQTSNVGTTGSSQGADTAPNSATLTSTINPVADVATTIMPSAASATAGQTASFAVTFKNNGPSDASAVTATVQLAAGLSGVTITGYGAGTATYNSTTGVVTYPSATYTNGTTNNSTISFTMPANGSLTGTSTINTTTNEAGLTANDVASATINGTPVFDLTTKISGPATTVAGTLTTYSVLTINNGPSSASNVGQTVQLPMNLTNVFVSNGGTYDATSGVVTLPTLSGLPSGAVVNNTVSFMAPSAAFPVSAIVSGDVNTTNNTAYLNGNASSTNVTVTPASTTNANLYTTITTPSANVQPGAAVTFTVVAGNNGPSAATGVVERVELPSGLTGVTVSNGGTYDATTGLVTFSTVASLISGTANTYTITANAPTSGIVAATASISATTNDPMMADNVATTDVTVSGVSDVATTISGPTKVNAGQSVTYTVTTTNNGIAPAANVVQTVNIPAGLTSVTISGGGSYDINTGIVTFPAIAGQVSGNSVQNTITYNAPAVASTMIIASVTSSSPDNVKTNNRAVITTTTDAIADVTVSLTGPATIVQGNQVDYLVVTTNNGPSSATNVATRVQLPAGLGTITLSAGGVYDNTTGIVTFSTLATERTGQPGTITNVIRFIAPAGVSQINATASVSTDTEESSYANNTSSIITTETAPTTTQTDLSTTITSTPATLTAGQPASLSVTTKNGGPGAATGVVQRVALEAGLTISSITNGGTYDAVTGIVTFPAISLASNTTTTNTITLVAPGTNPLQVRALVTGNESDATPSNNTDFKPLTINSVVDVATTVSGPTAVAVGDAVTYSVLTLNNGPSAASTVVQKVTIPMGLTGVVVSNGGTYDSGTGIVTFPTITSQNGDASSQVMNTISFTAPSTSFTVVGNVTTASTEPNTAATVANNTSTVTVGPINTAPVANAVINSLQTPQSNTAGALLLSPLSATDADGSVVSYTIASIPNATTQGVLTLNGTAVKVGDVILIADASKLRFDPVAAFVGNAFFTYTAKDNLNAVSAVAATYTIPVGQDNASVFVNTLVKGSGNAYANGDVISNGFDVNGGSYNSVAAVTDNGIRSATTDAAGTTTLANLGVSLNPSTGQLTVTDRTKLTQGTYSVSVTTTDVDGGVTTQTVTFTIGANPLPVVLTAFTAQAVQNRDALLNWTTASEQNSASFEVERSLDGSTFTKIGQVAAKGTSNSAIAYTFTDTGIGARAQGLVYYRLRQLDLNGAAYYSLVRTVGFTKATAVALSVYPNPATTSTVLDLSTLPASASYQVVVLDATGRQVLTATQAGGISQPLDLTSLASGTYQVLVTGKLADGSALRQVLRLIKE